MILEPPNGLRLGVARRRHIQLDAMFFDHRDDVRVFLGTNAVPQAHSAHGDRLTDAFGPCGFAGMYRYVHYHGPVVANNIFLVYRRMSLLVAVYVYSHDATTPN